jgi:hypothetical protein
MMQTSNTFGERITCDMESSLNDQVKKRRVQELQIARRLSTASHVCCITASRRRAFYAR